MGLNVPGVSNVEEIKIPSDKQYAIGVDGIYTKILPFESSPNVVYRVGDGTVHPEGWNNTIGNKYLDFYLPQSWSQSDRLTFLATLSGYESAAEGFRDEAEAFRDATQVLANTVTTQATQVSNDVVLSQAAQAAAAQSVIDAAAQVALATIQANISTAQAVISEDKADEASVSAANANANEIATLAHRNAAEAAKDSALSALDSFDDRYLGQKATAPTVDNDGDPLSAGSLYFDTTSNVMNVYDGSNWLVAYSSLQGALLVGNNLSDLANVSSARANLGVDPAGTVNYVHPATHYASEISDFDVEVSNNVDVAANTAVRHSHDQVLDTTSDVLFNSVNSTFEGPHVSDCKNVTTGTLLKGTPVYQSGTFGNGMEVQPAQASSALTMPAVGVLAQDLVAEAEGKVIHFGNISGVDTSLFGEGDTIYVGSTGGFVNVAPTGEGNLIQNLGRVTKVHATNGGGVVMGAGRANATPNLNDGNIFVGNTSNQAVSSPVKTVQGQSIIGSGDITIDALPDQTGHSGQFLTTNGAVADWADVVGAEHYDQETEPTPQAVGATWYVPSTAHLYKYVEESGNFFWIDISTAGAGVSQSYVDTELATKLDHNNTIYTSGTNVGIGTSSPDAKAHIKDTSWTKLKVESGGGVDASLELMSNGDVNNEWAIINDVSDNYELDIRHNNVTKMSIQSSGNVGIGTSSPRGKFAVYGQNNSICASFTGNTQVGVTGGSSSTLSALRVRSCYIINIRHTISSNNPVTAIISTGLSSIVNISYIYDGGGSYVDLSSSGLNLIGSSSSTGTFIFTLVEMAQA